MACAARTAWSCVQSERHSRQSVALASRESTVSATVFHSIVRLGCACLKLMRFLASRWLTSREHNGVKTVAAPPARRAWLLQQATVSSRSQGRRRWHFEIRPRRTRPRRADENVKQLSQQSRASRPSTPSRATTPQTHSLSKSNRRSSPRQSLANEPQQLQLKQLQSRQTRLETKSAQRVSTQRNVSLRSMNQYAARPLTISTKSTTQPRVTLSRTTNARQCCAQRSERARQTARARRRAAVDRPPVACRRP